MIIIRRQNNEYDKDIPYDIYINENLMGSIKNNEKLSFNLRGLDNNVIYIKASKKKSDVINFSLNYNQVIEFSCTCNKQKNILLELLRIIKREKIIKLKIDKDFIL